MGMKQPIIVSKKTAAQTFMLIGGFVQLEFFSSRHITDLRCHPYMLEKPVLHYDRTALVSAKCDESMEEPST